MINKVQELTKISISQGQKNSLSHRIGDVDGVYRCVKCEMGSWNTWKESCPVK